jgi:hypothetical protein
VLQYPEQQQDGRHWSLEVTQIRLVRDSGWADRLRAYHVIVDGEEVGEISNGETKDFRVSPGHHQIRLKIDWCGSNILAFEVAEGDKPTFYAKSNLRRGRVWLGLWYALFARGRYLLIEHGTKPLPPKR